MQTGTRLLSKFTHSKLRNRTRSSVAQLYLELCQLVGLKAYFFFFFFLLMTFTDGPFEDIHCDDTKASLSRFASTSPCSEVTANLVHALLQAERIIEAYATLRRNIRWEERASCSFAQFFFLAAHVVHYAERIAAFNGRFNVLFRGNAYL